MFTRLLTVDGANEVLLQAFVPRLRGGVSTRARALAGETRRWALEVRHELAIQGIQQSRLLERLDQAQMP